MLATSIRDIAREGRGRTYVSDAALNARFARRSLQLARLPTVEVAAADLPDAEEPAPRLTRDFLDLVAALVRSYRAKDLAAYARAFSCFCLFPERFEAPRYFPRARRVELALARLGVVDPRGGSIDGVPF